jgi:hypothetical protein
LAHAPAPTELAGVLSVKAVEGRDLKLPTAWFSISDTTKESRRNNYLKIMRHHSDFTTLRSIIHQPDVEEKKEDGELAVDTGV